MYVRHVQAGQTVALAGRLDASATAYVRAELHDAIDVGTGDLVIDLSGVELLDAAGLGVLVGAFRRGSRCGRSVVLSNPPARISRLLYATKLDRVLRVEQRGSASVVA